MPDNNSVEVKTRTFLGGGAELSIGIAMVNGTVVADRLYVERYTDNTDDILIFPNNGQRQVFRIRQVMTIQSSTPAVEAQKSISDQLEQIEGDEARHLLAIYDLFEGRTYPLSD